MTDIKIPAETPPISDLQEAQNEFSEYYSNEPNSKNNDGNFEYAYLNYKSKQLELTKVEQIIHLRKNFSRKIYWFTVGWSIAIFILLATQCFKFNCFKTFDSKVIITLITTSTANAFGFMYVIIKFIFNDGDLFKTNKKIKEPPKIKSKRKPKKGKEIA